MNYANAVRFAVGDVDSAILADEHAVRPAHFALERVFLGTIASLAGAGHGFNNSGPETDSSDRVALGIRDVEARLSQRDAFRS